VRRKPGIRRKQPSTNRRCDTDPREHSYQSQRFRQTGHARNMPIRGRIYELNLVVRG
jgi:hypothetical protein